MNYNHCSTSPTWQPLSSQSSMKQTDSHKKTELVRIEINSDKLRQLLNAGVLCAADFHCLDCRSKQCIWQICLADCIILNKKPT